MSEQNPIASGRTLLAAKIISNYGQSTIDCVVRRLSGHGATVTVESPLGVPKQFQLLIPNEGAARSCKLVWQSGRELGLEFETSELATEETPAAPARTPERSAESLMRGMMLTLRSALDEIETGVVLLDGDLRAQYINRAFRRMWALSDQMADSKPAFVSLMYHGRDTNAYELPAEQLDAYVFERIRLVRAGDATPRDLRRSNGEVIRMQCAVLPNGGRMLSYAYVTDIVRHADELEMLRNALDNISEGVLLLDADLKAQFLNSKTRDYWGVTPEQAARHPSYAELIANAPHAHAHGVPADQLDAFFAKRVEAIRAADPPIRDAVTPDGRHIRVHCTVTPNGGRMLTYCDVTDLVQNAQLLEKLATVDSMTGLYNRRHFLTLADGEWGRFQRYNRPLSMLAIDIDHFKSVNDRYGHAVGDDAIVSVANACHQSKRSSDIAGRLGGEEFFMLLPETGLAQAAVVAERLREKVAAHVLQAHRVQFTVTVSIGVAEASAGMSGIDVLLRAADDALYQAKTGGRNRVAQWTAPHAPKLAAE